MHSGATRTHSGATRTDSSADCLHSGGARVHFFDIRMHSGTTRVRSGVTRKCIGHLLASGCQSSCWSGCWFPDAGTHASPAAGFQLHAGLVSSDIICRLFLIFIGGCVLIRQNYDQDDTRMIPG